MCGVLAPFRQMLPLPFFIGVDLGPCSSCRVVYNMHEYEDYK